MARRDNDFMGLDVVSLEEAAVVGSIDGLIVDETANAVAGFVIDMGLYEAKALLFSEVKAVGVGAVTVESAAALKPISQQPILQEIAARGVQLSGMPVITDGGDLVGSVGEFYVDGSDGALEGLEILIEDAVAQRERICVVPMSQLVRIGLDLVMVRRGFQEQAVNSVDSL